MKKIVDFRKLLSVNENTELKELKTIYRNVMKDCHPDKILDNPEAKIEAEAKSKEIIEAYHFLVSIAPETKEANLEGYNLTTSASGITDFEYKAQTLKITFTDGSAYEYFDVPKNTYTKLVNSDSPGRFARRHIFTEFVYRNITKLATA
ncbi:MULTISPECIES: KTSC domain-containing protein [Arcticibacter]|uniref:Chaperone with DnaK n=1 Tax=Arcticibacter svalbardensis MN12-7 TaxID=1150600 RepID=R9H589_9SPHI|nr:MULTISPECIES: KTSC domain-containing protein [Arcticibacter]EOR96344.1 chaperone with DnaK [Arcticibacter svalbardensis MN12-7]